MGTLGRRPVQIVEIDIDKCTRTYGAAPCTAALGVTGSRKCFNSFKTCQDTPNYLAAPLTLRFGKNISGTPVGMTVFPALRSVSTSAGVVNLSGIDPKMSALGKRARVVVKLADFAYHDALTDPYRSERVSGAAQSGGIGYDPATRGTFFARMRARWPFYLGRSLRVLEGFEGDALVAMRTRHYVVTEWAGPDADGTVEITAKDILDLADNDKAKAPAPSRGKLAAAMTAGAASLTVSPATVGDEYGAAGLIAIGRELIRFTRAGDVFTLTERGAAGTTATTHSAADVVQEALEYTGQSADVIVTDLLTGFAGINPAFIDSAAWADEISRWLGGMVFSAIIAKPEGVADLVGEIGQLGVLLWWDDIAQKIRLAVNKPLDVGEVAIPVSDRANIIAGTAEVEDSNDERASRVLFYHGVIDATGGVRSADNFKKLVVATDFPSESPQEYGQASIKEIFTRWFGSAGDDANATVLADRLIARFRDVPRILKCDLDVKDIDAMTLTALIEADTRLIVDDTGAPEIHQMRLSSREEIEPGNRFRVEMRSFSFSGRFGFIMLDAAPDHDLASPVEQAEGCFIVDDVLLEFPDGSEPYVMF